ncbi:putative U3 small nucleolar ribonucleoprotein mpp10 [Mollisia scopiformis]|uniref:U3 small nucleolar ribonucleoprotein protein MPP10 n=1 Tax=Mollisia scopiformis TaxID=149040 RepID=A0A194X638_MOLSC|nr:putative U3 small nucleolar ribonucleoprotein mpp10 [Mollisia scopiformis]KUJ15646.1 putative U3 small nucleolar ribonucleo protein mpp10 [Mollisia scopiformis]
MTAFPPPSKSTQNASKNLVDGTTIANSILAALAPENRHAFIAPPSSLPQVSLAFAKETLDAFAGKLGDEQAERLKESRRKRKRGEVVQDEGEVLKIRKLHIDGFEVDQVWEQARRVIDALRVDAERALEEFGGEVALSDEKQEKDGGVELLKFDEDGFEIGSDDESAEDDEGAAEESENEEGSDVDPVGLGDDGDEEGLDDSLEGQDDYDDDEDDEEAAGVFVEDPNGLNDGFFSLDDFNKQTEFLERQDAAADPYTGEASDEEDIDWDADPLTMPAKPVSSSRRAKAMDVDEEGEDVDDEDEEEDGPTFGNADLNAPEGDSDDGEQDDEMEADVDAAGDNTNDILYRDFFEPPPRKIGKGEMQSNYLERQARKSEAAEPGDEAAEMERAVADVRRDLFDDLSDQDNLEDALSDVDAADPKSRKSAHERRQAKLAEEIRRLEAASVAKRQWTLAGEARAADRPMNSLLEEDLDFERTGKPVPEITAEISESIEELIKRRILAQEFDEVIRRRPDSLNTPASTRRGLFELDDSKPQQSLAEVYEEEHVKATNPDTYISKTDEKMRKEEKEIEAMWKDVSAKLDTLSSWHYKPKPAAPSLTVVSDVATIAMEDAQPTTASGINGGESMLAPQEIYKAGKEKDSFEKGEVVPRSGAPVARQEMTREEKLRRRRREKERIKKRGGEEINQRPESKKTKQRKDTLGDLKKGGVKVIGRKGDIRDMSGNKVKASAAINGAGGFKL